jgi:hypothetical protein
MVPSVQWSRAPNGPERPMVPSVQWSRAKPPPRGCTGESPPRGCPGKSPHAAGTAGLQLKSPVSLSLTYKTPLGGSAPGGLAE